MAGYDKNHLTVSIGAARGAMDSDIERAVEIIRAFEGTIRQHETDPYYVRAAMRETLELLDQKLESAGVWRSRLCALEEARSFVNELMNGDDE